MTSSSSGGKGPLSLTNDQSVRLFPFHLVFDANLRVVQAGASLIKVCPGAIPGADMRELLEIERPKLPFEFTGIAAAPDSIFLLKARGSTLKLRGQMLSLGPDRIAFLCSPWAPEPGMLRSLGLQLTDFPIHDAMPELVHVVQSQRLAMDDLQRLAGKLREQRQSLRIANGQLIAREGEARRLAMIASRTENCVIVTDATGLVEWVNESFTRLTGYSFEEIRGRSPGSVLQGEDTDPATVAYMSERLAAGQGFQCEVLNYNRDRRPYWVAIEVQPIFDDAGALTGFMAIESDITARRDFELRNRLAYAVTRVLADSADAPSALSQVLKEMAEGLDCQFGGLWRVSLPQQRLSCTNHWSAPPLAGSRFETETLDRRFARGEGLPGRIWSLNAPLRLAELVSAENFPRGSAAIASGLRSGFAFPIRLAGEIRGVMEFYSTGLRQPSDGMLETLTGLGAQLEQFLVRREAEEQRGEVLALLDSTLESSAEGILVTDLGGRPTRVNQRWLDLWQVPLDFARTLDREGLLTWVNRQLSDPQARDEARTRLLSTPGMIVTDQLPLRDGRVIEVVSTPHTMHGHIVGRVWMYRDVTEKSRSQKQREELLATLNATLEATTDGILVADLDQRIVAFNRRFLQLWRIPPEQASRRAAGELRDLIRGQLSDPDEFDARIEYLYAHQQESSVDVIHFLDGRVYERYSQPQRAGDQVIGRVWSYRDVTERWKAEQSLRESEQRYRIVMESANDAIVTVDERGVIVFASRSSGRVFGYPPEQLPGMLVWRLVPPELRDPEELRRLIRGSRSRPWHALEVEALCRDGSRRPVEISLHRARAGGRKLVTGVLRDISQRKLVEQSLREATEAAENANRAKSDFLANISHEIRTPLNSIVGFTEMLRKTPLDRDQQEMLTSVWASSESLLSLINDLLDVSKIEAGQVDIELVEFDPAALCEQVVEILQLRAARKGLAVSFVADPPAPPRLLGDAYRIRQVIINLLSNAVKFTESGLISLLLQWRREDDGIVARFSVSDTGIGIPLEHQARIFEKFFRVNDSAGRRTGGAGLGLSISKLLSEAMGGSLGLVSSPGQGSTFTLALPLREPEVAQAQPAPAPLRSLLLTTAQWRGIQLRVLISAGLSADPFTSAAEAMSWADAAAPYDLFILDESVEASPEQIRQIVRLCSLGKDLRTLRLRRPGAPERPGWDLPGRAVELEWPLTPARVRRAIEFLYAASPSEHDAAGPGWAAPGPVERGASVLLVEDNPDSQAYALRVLNGAGHSVDVASTGEQAVRLAGSQRYEVILMDVMLPDMTGFEATRQIRVLEKQSGQSAVPVVALTAHALLEYRREAFSSEMNDYVTKPVRPSALLNAVRQWAGQGIQERATPQGEVLVSPDVADLVPGYLERARRQLDEIQSHARAGAAGPAARLAHNLKGTGKSYGFAIVTEAGARMEEAARAGDCDSVAREAAELSRLLEKVRWKAAPP